MKTRKIHVVLISAIASGLGLAMTLPAVSTGQEALENCGKTPNCTDAGTYTATIEKVFESTTEKSRMVRLIVRFRNVSSGTIILAYRAESGFLLDNFRNRYFCSQAGQIGANAQDNSAVGIGIDRGSKIDPQFALKPGKEDIVSFDLGRSRSPEQQATSYDFDLMIDEIDPRDLQTVVRHPYLSFRNLRPKALKDSSVVGGGPGL